MSNIIRFLIPLGLIGAIASQGTNAQQPAGVSLAITVLDAQTKQPIPEFQLLAGVISGVRGEFEKRTGLEVYAWQAHTIRTGKNGQLQWPTARSYDKMVFRIEAPGYRPQRSKELSRNALPEELEILLDPDLGLRG